MNENLPKRKHPRLKEYDYSSEGVYFVTIREGKDYEVKSQYIHENPLKWQFDELYTE